MFRTMFWATMAILAAAVFGFALGAIGTIVAGLSGWFQTGRECAIVFGILGLAVATFVCLTNGTVALITWGAGTKKKAAFFIFVLVVAAIGFLVALVLWSNFDKDMEAARVAVMSAVLMILSILYPLAEGLARTIYEWLHPKPQRVWKAETATGPDGKMYIK